MELKDITTYLGISDEIKTFDEFKAAFDGEFVRQSSINEEVAPVKAILGKRFGSLETALKRVAGQVGADWSSEDFKDKSIEDRVKLTIDKLANDHKSELDEFKKTHGGNSKEIVAEWEGKFNKLKQEKLDVETMIGAIKAEYEGFKASVENEKKSYKINTEKEAALKDFKWKTGTNDFTKRGFMDALNEKYKVDINTDGKLTVYDAQGKQIPNTKVAGTFMTFAEVVMDEAVKADLYEKNPAAGQRTNVPIGATAPVRVEAPSAPARYIHPAAVR